uniref:Uncharacterized protein n=1 Tax=Rhizophora mucronata TaxID=61149 RepID=A0A2P2IZ60_RHIMU
MQHQLSTGRCYCQQLNHRIWSRIPIADFVLIIL